MQQFDLKICCFSASIYSGGGEKNFGKFEIVCSGKEIGSLFFPFAETGSELSMRYS